ncbi:MAG: wax ester/triacylglycerol synthase family O-acyltransferase [Actinomycetota bacterium]
MDRLSAEDRLMLWPDKVWPQDIGALVILDGTSLLELDGRFRIEAVLAAIEARLHLVPRFRQRLYIPGRWRGGPLWVDAATFNIQDHVRVEPVPAPCDEAQLLRTVEQLRRRRMDRSQPMWEMWFLPGLSKDRIGLFVRMHHAMADGMAGVATLATLLDGTPDVAIGSPEPWTPAPLPSDRDLIADNLRRRIDGTRRAVAAIAHPVSSLLSATATWPALREIFAEKPGPETSLDRRLGADRTFALIRSNIDLAKETAHTHGAKVNDVLLTAIAGGLRALLQSRGEPIQGIVIPIYVPVSLHREQPGGARGNQVSQMMVPLPIGVADSGRRLRLITAETARRKARSHPNLGILYHGGIFGRIIGAAVVALLSRQRVNVTSADLPGPSTPLYFAGARVLEVFPILPLVSNESLGVGALSYAGQFNIMAVADKDAYPDIEEFAAGVRAELRALEATHAGAALA